jgi:hypothetical protein
MFRRAWKEADATVIVARNFVSTAADIAGMDSSSDLVVEVHPDGDDAFRAEAKISYLGLNLEQRKMRPPDVGDTIRVEYNPKTHEVKVLYDPEHDRKALAKDKNDAFQAALHLPVGSAAPMRDDVARALQNAGLGDLLKGATIGENGEIDNVIEMPPQIFVQSDGEAPEPLATSPLDPAIGGAAGILAKGVPCRVTLLGTFPLPGQKTSTGEDATGLVMSVTIDGQPPYQAQTGAYVPPEALARLAPGTALVGKAMPGNTGAVAIDWNAFLAT